MEEVLLALVAGLHIQRLPQTNSSEDRGVQKDNLSPPHPQ